jgi:hypothetical protein
MKKSTLAVAALLTALSSASVMSVAYAEDAATTPAATKSDSCKGACKGTCKGSECKGASCKGTNCKGAPGSNQ